MADTGGAVDGQHTRQGVHGFVRHVEGRPVPRATVTLISLDGRQLDRSVTHTDGSYALDAPGPGSYVLITAADGHQPQASTVVVGEEPLGYDISLDGSGGLAGVVRAEAGGRPVDEALVVVTDAHGEVLATGTTGEQGEFAFDELVEGSFTVAVTAAGFQPAALLVEAGGQGVTRAEIALRSGARVQGTVRAGAPDGERGPLADARVTLVDAAGKVVAVATTGEDGGYTFTDLDSGDYTVIASGYPPVAGALTITGSGVDGHDVELAHPVE
ncbi:MSCRAMM family protein [Streptomyces palmae]|uniref:MSCRAMM family protein n=1 Tax=Streptomyces palmae TaxID=1701085 RepID=UPI0014330B48